MEENNIIGKFIEEDEKQSVDLNLTQNEDIKAWKGFSKIEISKKLKSYSNLSPDFHYPNIQRPQNFWKNSQKFPILLKIATFIQLKKINSYQKS